MSEEIKTENQNKEEVQETTSKEEVQTQKTFTLQEVQNLLSAKNHEKEARKNAEAQLKNLREENAKLKGEDSVSKYKEDEYNNLKAELESLKKEKEQLEIQNKNNALKDQLRKINGLNAAAIDDVLDKALKRGFQNTEVGYIDKNGKTLADFEKDIKQSHSYYFGLSSNKNVIPTELQESINKAKKYGSTISIVKEGFKHFKPN